MSKKFIVVLFSFISAVLAAGNVRAAGLEDFEGSGQMNVIADQTDKHEKELYSCDWGGPQTNYGRLFCGRQGNLVLSEWLNLQTTAFKCERAITRILFSYIEMARSCQASKGRPISILLMVPHPRYLAHVEGGLLEDFKKLEPPLLVADSVESISVHNFPAKIFRKKDGACSILIKLAKGAVLNLSGRCEDLEQIKALGEDLTIDRLNSKLES
ncbi:MAG: hypothetical protein GX589_09500 [Deltaproteobacteria bacterium]|nr:hypothetical protein [Deltaproteobacteria bacterium]